MAFHLGLCFVFISIGRFFPREWKGMLMRKIMTIAVSIIILCDSQNLLLLETGWPENNCPMECYFLLEALKDE